MKPSVTKPDAVPPLDSPKPAVSQPTPKPHQDREPLRPDVRQAFEESWERDQDAYRYLAR